MAERLEDLNLPNASVAKIIKDAIPESINIGKEARTALARAAAVFVLFISTHASQEAQKANRKTLLGQDVIDALSNLEFEEFIEPLNEYLESKRVNTVTLIILLISIARKTLVTCQALVFLSDSDKSKSLNFKLKNVFWCIIDVLGFKNAQKQKRDKTKSKKTAENDEITEDIEEEPSEDLENGK